MLSVAIIVLFLSFLATAQSLKSYDIVNGVCPFTELGLEFGADKVGPIIKAGNKLTEGHRYGPLYCEILTPLRQTLKRKARVLEIGFGCGHYNNGVSARVFKKYFQDNDGPDVLLYEVDYKEIGADEERIRACMTNFEKEYPKVVTDLYFGDQSNRTFLGEVIAASGGKYDIVVDDGGHYNDLILTSLEVLWSQVVPGGYYIIEDLSQGLIDTVHLITSWSAHVACGKDGMGCNPHHGGKVMGKYSGSRPKDLQSVRCHNEICALQKAFE